MIPLWVAIVAGVFTLANTIVDRIDFNKIIIASIQQPRTATVNSAGPQPIPVEQVQSSRSKSRTSAPVAEGFSLQKLPEQPVVVTVLKWFQMPIVRYSGIGVLISSIAFFVIRLIVVKRREAKEKK
jgi:hypothetical protein